MTALRQKWNGRARQIPIGSQVCAARVVTLVAGIEKQIRALSPKFRWAPGHELYVAIVAAEGDCDLVTGFALAKGGRAKRIVLANKDDVQAQRKLHEAVATPISLPVARTRPALGRAQ